MSHPTFRKETFVNLKSDVVGQQDVVTTWEIIKEAFESVNTDKNGGSFEIDVSDGEVTMSTRGLNLATTLEDFRKERRMIKKISVRAYGLDKNGGFKNAGVIYWFDEAIKVHIDVHATSNTLSEVRSWGTGIFTRLENYISKIGTDAPSGMTISKEGKINPTTEKEQALISGHIINNMNISALISGNNITGKKELGKLEKAAAIAAILTVALTIWFKYH